MHFGKQEFITSHIDAKRNAVDFTGFNLHFSRGYLGNKNCQAGLPSVNFTDVLHAIYGERKYQMTFKVIYA